MNPIALEIAWTWLPEQPVSKFAEPNGLLSGVMSGGTCRDLARKIDAALVAYDARLELLRSVLETIADTENPEHYGNARDALHAVKLAAQDTLNKLDEGKP